MLGFLFLVAFIALIVGLFKPELVLRWGEVKTRKRVFKIYGTVLIVLLSLAAITNSNSEPFKMFLSLIVFYSFIALALGIINPNWIWLYKLESNRKNILKMYGLTTIIFSIIVSQLYPSTNINPKVQSELVQQTMASHEESKQLKFEDYLQFAKNSLSKNYDPSNDLWGNVDEAKQYLTYVPDSFPGKVDVQKEIQSRLDKQEAYKQEQLKKQQEQLKQQQEAEKIARQVLRKQMAKQMEQVFLKSGMDVYVEVSGDNDDIITMTYVLWSRPLIYKFVNEANILTGLKDAGFKKAIFDDKYQNTWTYDL